MIKYDYSALIGKIVEKYGSQRNFCKATNMAERTLSIKLNGKSDFKQEEILKICELLAISSKQIPSYFFAVDAQN